ncbi:MAG: EF-hand domain-containing protein [archaeon]|nr:EF-hand domain-containing protein [archaeon]
MSTQQNPKMIGTVSKKGVMSREMKDKMMAAFKLYDCDKNGKISPNDFYKRLSAIGQKTSFSEVEQMILDHDRDGDKELNFMEFCGFYEDLGAGMGKGKSNKDTKKVKREKSREEEIREVFDLYDYDQNDFVGIDDFYQVTNATGVEVTREDAEQIILKYDKDKDRELNFEEFCDLYDHFNDILTKLKKKMEQREKGIKDKPKEDSDEDIEDEDRVVKAFKFFDKKINKKITGKLTNKDFRHILQDFFYKFSPKFVDALFEASNLKDDGYVDYREFVSYWRKHEDRRDSLREAIEFAQTGGDL